MPRIARIVAIGYPHHITQRGNYRQRIFSSDTDRKKYLSLLKNEGKRYGLTILAYCLMPNHVHFIVIPEREDSMGKVFKYAHMKYSQYYNKKMRTQGHLFQGRFFSCVMDERHTLACTRYIERNPVRAKMVNKPYLWNWSSAKVHCGIDKHDELEVNKLFDYIDENQKTWKKFIELSDDPNEIKQIREQTRKGRPLGTYDFVERLEEKLKRFLKLKPKGRPRKVVEK
ncbi:MAG: hypothetical protein A2Z72_08625 [Omnitrophica bacterium RBG_13_46_9]|nr:MAG: hypothetical protein A2Z72_08625 [Omnitrophica bacterium RBG_13_46_9]